MSRESQPSRLLHWEECYNARDLGGYPTAGGGQTRWGVLVRSDNLCRLTPAGCEALIQFGVRTVIDLRSEYEFRDAPHPFALPEAYQGGPRYLHRPLMDVADLEAARLIDAAETAAEVYYVIVERFQRLIAAVITEVAQAPEGAVVFHCHAGKDRTGIVAALLLELAGVPRATIVDDYALTEAYLEPYSRRYVAAAADEDERLLRVQQVSDPRNRATADRMEALLTFLEQRYGGAYRYLAGAGVTPADLARVRERLRTS